MTNAMMAMAQMPMWQDGGHVMGLHWGWWTFWIVLLVFLVWAVARGFGGGGRERVDRGSAVSAEERLRRRFAEGEIDEEEYNRRLETLRNNSG